MKVLVLNGGSSSFKCWFCELGEGPLPVEAPQPLWSARVDWSRHSGLAEMQVRRSDGTTVSRSLQVPAPVAVLQPTLELLWSGDAKVIDSPQAIDVVGHRIVDGGPTYRDTTPLIPEVRRAIAREVEAAPTHNRFELEAVEVIDSVIGSQVLQLAVFDTSFHRTLEPPAYTYPGPREWLEQGIRRYGFHGISYRYVAQRAAQMLGGDPTRLIACHLGNGASVAAIRRGKSIDTTMGFTPLEGLMMGTRSGSIDPGILIHLIRQGGYTAEHLDELLNQRSGLLGLSGISSDMREIVGAMESGNQQARLAFDVYLHRLTREFGGMLAVLGGLDALVFTGGVGENCALVRQRLCEQLDFLGVKLVAAKNARPQLDQDIAAPDSRVRVLVIRAQEEWEIARECHQLVHALSVPRM